MLNCSVCNKPIGGDTIQLADGSRLCQKCFQSRFQKAKQRAPISIMTVMSVLQPLVVGGAVLGMCYLGYQFYMRQQRQDQEERIAEQQRDAKEAERQRNENEQMAKYQQAEKELYIKMQAMKEAELKVRREQKELAAAEKDALRKQIEDLQRNKRKPAAVAPVEKAPVPEIVPTLTPEQIAEIKVQFAKTKKALSDAAQQRTEDDRKMAAYTNQFDTYSTSAARLSYKYNGNFQPAIVRGGSFRTPDTDRQNAIYEYQKSVHESQKAMDAINLLKGEMLKREVETTALKKDFRKLKEQLGIADPAGVDSALPPSENPFTAAKPATASKAIFLKNGTKLRIQSAMAVGDEWQYKDLNGEPGSIPKAAVESIEKDPE